jgi:hypothetical protein
MQSQNGPAQHRLRRVQLMLMPKKASIKTAPILEIP